MSFRLLFTALAVHSLPRTSVPRGFAIPRAAVGMIVRRRWRFDGRVQQVGFRAFCEESARGRGLRGWVRNECDGSVSVEAEGDHEVLADFLQHLQKRHLPARVDRTEEVLLVATHNAAESFEIR
jgi:acylphosphatase